MSDTGFAEQVVVVVGAANGIGLATARSFAAAGAKVGWTDKSHSVEALSPHAWQADATCYSELVRLAERIQAEFGRIDHVVVSIGACTGTLGFPFWNVDPSAWSRSLEVNLIAVVNVAHAFVPAVLDTRETCTNEAVAPSFCFVTSVAGQIGSQTDPPYSAAKAGLINFTQCAAKDLAPYGIRANAVSPGMVQTAMNREVWQAWAASRPEKNTLTYEEWAADKIRQITPLQRWQTASDVADAIVFLASRNARNITGQTINVDGGQVMHA